MSQIAELTAHDKKLDLQLNGSGRAVCWLDLLDPVAANVTVHQTSLRLDRNNKTVWSGPIFNAQESSSSSVGTVQGQDKLEITALGWLEILNHRLIHTGAEFLAMRAALGFGTPIAYLCPGTDTATQLVYSATQFPTTTDAVIITDLLTRANIDSQTNITMGNVYGSPVQRNLTLQRFQNVGQQITQLVNVESGCDIYIDPVTRALSLFGPGASSSPTISSGMGSDRTSAIRFTYPGNCTTISRSQDGARTANRMEAIGQYGVGRADDIGSQGANGLFEASDSLSEVVDPNILTAYANVEVTVRTNPWTIITFAPRPIAPRDSATAGVPRPFDDYFLGDIAYTVISRGKRFQVGTVAAPQPVRIFGFSISIDDATGVEHVSNLQTTYQGLGAT